jgi:hypothetical protein
MPNICGDCGVDNDPNAKFCAECGWTFSKKPASAVNPCKECGFDNVPNAKFCAECGWTFPVTIAAQEDQDVATASAQVPQQEATQSYQKPSDDKKETYTVPTQSKAEATQRLNNAGVPMKDGGGADQISIVNPVEFANAMNKLKDNADRTDWVLIDYAPGAAKDLSFTAMGENGVAAVKALLRDDLVQFAVLQVQIKDGDAYTPVKYCMLSWIGPGVQAGLKKSRASVHRDSLMTLIKNHIPINGMYQADRREDVNPANIAHAVTRISALYGTAEGVAPERQAMSRSDNKKGGASLVKLVVADEAKVREGLLAVHKESCDWAILSYVEGGNNQVELVMTGSGGPEELGTHFPSDRIYFCVLRIKQQHGLNMSKDSLAKVVLVTLIGKNVKPMAKARSSAQRMDIADYVQGVIPFHGYYQTEDKASLNAKEILSKFK